MLLSPFIPTSPSHPFIPMSISLFSISVSPLMLCKQVHQYHRSRVYICVNIRYLFFSFWLTSLCIIGSRFIHLIRTDSNVFFLISSVIFHCVYVPQLSYPLVCQWTSRLLSCPSYCKQCCNEHWDTCVSFSSGFFGVYAQQWDCWVIQQFYFQYFKESLHCSLYWVFYNHCSM